MTPESSGAGGPVPWSIERQSPGVLLIQRGGWLMRLSGTRSGKRMTPRPEYVRPHQREAGAGFGLADRYVVVPGYGSPEDTADTVGWAGQVEGAVFGDSKEPLPAAGRGQ